MNIAANPANVPPTVKTDRARISMSLPVPKLAAPDIPGYHTHWMLGTQQRLQQALRAGYVYVEQDEMEMNRIGLGEGPESDGHSDLGSRVSVISGTNEQGAVERLYLMKLPQALWEEDQQLLEKRQDQIAAQIRGDGFAQAGGDNSNRYTGGETKKSQSNLFNPKRRS